MVFWYAYCLNFLKMSLSTSNYHHQGRAGVKQKVMRLNVSVCVNRASYMYHFATQRGLKEPETRCSFGTTFDPYQKMSLNVVGFKVLSSAGDEVFTNRKNFTRARLRSRSFDNSAAVSSCKDEQGKGQFDEFREALNLSRGFLCSQTDG